MSTLTQETCIPCQGNLPSLSDLEITQLLPQIPDWEVVEENEEKHLKRTYTFSNFKQALAFTQAVGEAAETAGHHPVLVTQWGQVTVTWWTHAINGLHRNDFIMAAKTDEIARTL